MKKFIIALCMACSPALFAQTFTYTGGPDDIPDDDLENPLCTTVNVPAGTVSGEVTVEFAVTHSWIGDLNISLDSPDEASAEPIFLRDRLTINGEDGFGDSSDLDAGNPISFFDSADFPVTDMGVNCANSTDVVGVECPETEFVPSQPFSTFDGESAIGDWTLCIGDGANADTGTLTSWSLIGDGSLPIELQTFSID